MLTDDQIQLLKVVLILLILKRKQLRRIGRRLDTNSMLRGYEYVNEILDGNPAHSIEILRMRKEVFMNLCTHLRNKGWLQNSYFVSVEEKVAMFLITMGHHHTNRVVKRRYCHSTHTIHTYFYEVLQAMLHFSKEMIVPNFNGNQHASQQQHRLLQIFQVFSNVSDLFSS